MERIEITQVRIAYDDLAEIIKDYMLRNGWIIAEATKEWNIEVADDYILVSSVTYN